MYNYKGTLEIYSTTRKIKTKQTSKEKTKEKEKKTARNNKR